MSVVIGPPREGSAGYRWNALVQKHRVARWVDEWWYERTNIPAMGIAIGLEAGIWLLGLFVLPIPAVIYINTARLAASLNEFHTAALWVRHGDLSLFNQSQTWERHADGSIRRNAVAADLDLRRLPVTGTLMRRGVEHTRRHASDLITQRRRLPGFILGNLSLALSFTLGSFFHAPAVAIGAITYTFVFLGTFPLVRSAWHSLRQRSLRPFQQPQLVAPPERGIAEIPTPDLGMAAPSADLPGEAVPTATLRAADTPAPGTAASGPARRPAPATPRAPSAPRREIPRGDALGL